MAVEELDTWPKAVLVSPLLVNGEQQHIQEVICALSLRRLFWSGVNPELGV